MDAHDERTRWPTPSSQMSSISSARFAPFSTRCDAHYDERKHKFTKVPTVRGWTSLTAERSAQLVDGRPEVEYLMFATGERTGLFVMDHDRLNPERPDHVGCIDGVEAGERWFGPIDTPDTFTTRSIGGGYHKVYQMTPQLAAHIKNGPLVKGVLLEVLYNKRAFMYGKGCAIVHRMLPQPPSTAVQQVYYPSNRSTPRSTLVRTPSPPAPSRRPRPSTPCCAPTCRGRSRRKTRRPSCCCQPPTSAACRLRCNTRARVTAASMCTAPAFCSPVSATANGCCTAR